MLMVGAIGIDAFELLPHCTEPAETLIWSTRPPQACGPFEFKNASRRSNERARCENVATSRPAEEGKDKSSTRNSALDEAGN